jgi:bifunctional non-homologous end joining protein LigD
MGALELHAWNGRAPDLSHPDQIVMDFDPDPSVPWKKMVSAARDLRALLADLGLESFVKVTGGKGLHVHVPISPTYAWEQVKEFSHALARELVSRKPKLYTIEMAKSARKGKIFLDYLRNEEMATAVLPYSLRAKEKSAVALPVGWEELSRIGRSDAFTLPKALAKVRSRRHDPWEGYSDLRQKIHLFENQRKAA